MEDEIRALLEKTLSAAKEEDTLLTLADVLERVPWSRPTVLAMVRRREIPMLKVRGKWIITRRAFREAADRGFRVQEYTRVRIKK